MPLFNIFDFILQFLGLNRYFTVKIKNKTDEIKYIRLFGEQEQALLSRRSRLLLKMMTWQIKKRPFYISGFNFKSNNPEQVYQSIDFSTPQITPQFPTQRVTHIHPSFFLSPYSKTILNVNTLMYPFEIKRTIITIKILPHTTLELKFQKVFYEEV